MGNTFFDNALKGVKIDFEEIKTMKKCQYFLEKEGRLCNKVFKSKGKFNRYCPQCNMLINETNKYNYIKYTKGKKGGRCGKRDTQ